jgi:hypothetical protein
VVGVRPQEVIHDDNRVVLLVGPERQGWTPVTQAQLRSASTAGLLGVGDALERSDRGQGADGQGARAGTVKARREVPRLASPC